LSVPRGGRSPAHQVQTFKEARDTRQYLSAWPGRSQYREIIRLIRAAPKRHLREGNLDAPRLAGEEVAPCGVIADPRPQMEAKCKIGVRGTEGGLGLEPAGAMTSPGRD